jgi:teichuronic acid biosynthesis glycosyltransferase TuaC
VAEGHYSRPVLRLLSLTSAYPDAVWPGAGSFVEHQLRALAARPGVEVEVVAPAGLPPFPLSLAPRHRRERELRPLDRVNGLTVHRPRYRMLPLGGRWRSDSMARAAHPTLRAIRRRFPFDIIQAEFFWPDGPAAMRLAEAFGVPFSIKARGGDFERPAAGYGWAQRLVMEAGEKAACLLAVSETLRAAMVRRGLPAERIAVPRTGLDRTQFKLRDREAARTALRLDGPVLLNVGNLVPRKRQRLAIETLACLGEAILILVGGGPDRSALERHARELGVEDRVRFMGSLPQPLLPFFYAAADVTLHTSEVEGLSNAWVESLACGTPVVTTGAGAAREMIDRREAGFVVPPDSGTIAAAIRALIERPPAPAAVAACVEGLSWDRNAAELEAHLRAAVGA